MRVAMVGLCLLLFSALAWAGTLKDNFDDENFYGWQIGNVNGGSSTWVVKDGVLTGTRLGDWSAGLSIGEFTTWKDVTIEVDAKMITAIEVTHAIGLSLRVQDINMNQEVLFGIGNWIGLNAFALVWDNPRFVKTVKQPFPFELNRWYHLKGSVVENRYRFYVDKQLLLDVKNDLYESGRVAIVIDGSKALYDNVVITGNDLPDRNLSVEPNAKLATRWATIKQRR